LTTMDDDRKKIYIRGGGMLEIITINGELAEMILHVTTEAPSDDGNVRVYFSVEDTQQLYIYLTPYLGPEKKS